MDDNLTFAGWWRGGDPFIWLNALAVGICLVAVLGLVLFLLVRSVAYFWPAPLLQFRYQVDDGVSLTLAGQLQRRQWVDTQALIGLGFGLPQTAVKTRRLLFRLGNHGLGGEDYRWILTPYQGEPSMPADLAVIERRHSGPLFGYLVSVTGSAANLERADGADPSSWTLLRSAIKQAAQLQQRVRRLQKIDIAPVNRQLERLRRQEQAIVAPGGAAAVERLALEGQRERQLVRRRQLDGRVQALRRQLAQQVATFRLADGRQVQVAVAAIVRAYRPNALGVVDKLEVFADRVWEFLTAPPREGNSGGGIYPALFGTVLMVIVMSIVVAPLGVLVAVYLREYARQGLLTRVIRITVHNLAGVPSVVYGMFGLGFFVYAVGGRLDQWFFAERLPAPTFGTPGLLWAALTMALLTLPVVIVATEEGLARVPRQLREGSLALGATRLQTLVRLVLPMAGPAMMTGLILAVARAAGEVAPLMLVGVVKLAPALPVDGDFPYLHLERKFMHLGYHIYDVGFQSAGVDAARAMVFASALLLVVVVGVLNLSAIRIRHRLRDRVRALDN